MGHDVAQLNFYKHTPPEKQDVRSGAQNGIRIYEIARRSRRSAPTEGGAQTGHRGAVSYTGLVADADHAQAGCKELFDQVVFFVIESSATKVGHGSRMHYDLSVPLLPA